MMECPKCKHVELEKNDPSKPFWCPVCGGMWVSIHEIEDLSQSFVDDLRVALADSACAQTLQEVFHPPDTA